MNFPLLLLLLATFVVANNNPPNLILILTDDQNRHDDVTHMPKLQKYLANEGTTINNMFVSTPVCCPSRSSIYTGKYIHNIDVHNNSAGSGGCGSVEFGATHEKLNVAHYLKDLRGYSTSFSGKYLNNYGFGSKNGTIFALPQCLNTTATRAQANMENTCAMPIHHIPQGWDNWQALVGNSVYYNYSMSNNGVKEEHGDDYETDYFIDVVKNKSLSFIQNHHTSSPSSPFFVTMAVPGVHEPADPAPQHANYASDLKAPRYPNYNKVMKGDNRHWMIENVNIDGSPMNDTVISFVDLLYRRRMAVLQSIDDLIEELVQKLDSIGELDNTYILYTSDNGYHLGEFAVPIDKRLPYESDVRVPAYIRGPNIRKNYELDNGFMVNIDIAPTMLRLAGVEEKELAKLGMDGSSVSNLIVEGMEEEGEKRTEFLLEYEGENIDGCWHYLNNTFPEGYFFDRMTDNINCGLRGPFSYVTHPLWDGEETFGTIQDATNNTYDCVREINLDEGVDHQFCKFSSGEVEIFDLTVDPWQLTNLWGGGVAGDDFNLYERKMKRLEELKGCKGAACR